MDSYVQILNAVRALADNKQPDTDISRILYEHNCFYLLSTVTVSNMYTEKYKAEAILNRICIRERFQACRELFDALQHRKILYAVIKGAVLSVAAYGNPYSRKSGDIDLLISRGDIDEVKQILLNQGFMQGRVTINGIQPFSRKELLFYTVLSHQIAPFVKGTGNPLCPYVNVDINMDILWGESGRQSNMDFVLSHTGKMDICGVLARKLTCEMEFIALCLHHYKDMNSLYLLAQGNLRLSLFCDIFFYIKHCRPDISKLRALCEQLDVLDYVCYCVYYTAEIFDDPLLSFYQTTLQSDTYKGVLTTFGLTKQEQRNWEIPFFERLFTTNISRYFATHLSANDLGKIRLNRKYI